MRTYCGSGNQCCVHTSLTRSILIHHIEMSISSATVARVFHELSFKNEKTRIASSSVALSTEYMRLFVQEAIIRSNAQRLAEVPPSAIDGIDNVESQADADNIDNDQFRENASDEEFEERGLGVSTQMPPPSVGNDTLDSRHLAAVAGMLVMDF